MIVRKIMYALEGFFVGIDTHDRAHLMNRSTGESLCLTEWITPRFTPEDFSMCSVCADTRETQSAFKGNPKPASEPTQVLEAMDSRSYRVVGRGDVYMKSSNKYEVHVTDTNRYKYEVEAIDSDEAIEKVRRLIADIGIDDSQCEHLDGMTTYEVDRISGCGSLVWESFLPKVETELRNAEARVRARKEANDD